MNAEDRDELEMHRINCLGVRITLRDARMIRRAASSLHNLDVRECNGELSEGEWDRKESAIMRRLHRADFAIGEHSLSFEHQTDPRGPALKVWKDGNAGIRHNVGTPRFGAGRRGF